MSVTLIQNISRLNSAWRNESRLKKLCIIASALVLSVASVRMLGSNNISGTYIERQPNSVSMIRLVETEDQRLSGQAQEVILLNDGTVKDFSASIDGRTDGKNISLTINLSSLNAPHITGSGTYNGNSIILTTGITGQAPSTSKYIVGKLEAFQSEANLLREKSRQILTSKAQAKASKITAEKNQATTVKAQNLTDKLQTLNAEVGKIANKSQAVEDKYHQITSQLQKMHDTARNITDDSYGLKTNSIVIAMRDGVLVTEDIHRDIQLLHNNLENRISELTNEYETIKSNCHSSLERKKAVPACEKLEELRKSLHTSAAGINSTFDTLEKTYQTELKAQEELIQSTEQNQ